MFTDGPFHKNVATLDLKDNLLKDIINLDKDQSLSVIVIPFFALVFIDPTQFLQFLIFIQRVNGKQLTSHNLFQFSASDFCWLCLSWFKLGLLGKFPTVSLVQSSTSLCKSSVNIPFLLAGDCWRDAVLLSARCTSTRKKENQVKELQLIMSCLLLPCGLPGVKLRLSGWRQTPVSLSHFPSLN